MKIKIILIIITISLLFANCKTTKEVVTDIKEDTKIEKHDSSSTRQTTELRDTTLNKKLDADSVKKDAPIINKLDSCYFEPLFAYGKYGWAKAWSLKGKAYLFYHEGGMDIEIRLDNALKTSKYWYEKYSKESEKKSRIEVRTETITKTKNNLLGNICIGIVCGFIIIGGILLLFVKIRK